MEITFNIPQECLVCKESDPREEWIELDKSEVSCAKCAIDADIEKRKIHNGNNL